MGCGLCMPRECLQHREERDSAPAVENLVLSGKGTSLVSPIMGSFIKNDSEPIKKSHKFCCQLP